VRPGLTVMRNIRENRCRAFRLACELWSTANKKGAHVTLVDRKPEPAQYGVSDWEAGRIWQQVEEGLPG
jgi:hypothetical protein